VARVQLVRHRNSVGPTRGPTLHMGEEYYVAHVMMCTTESETSVVHMLSCATQIRTSVAHMLTCATEVQVSVAHTSICATESPQ
jgi:hypothetical protein